MTANTKKIVLGALSVPAILWLGVVAYIATLYLLDMRYEQQVKRNALEAIEESRVEATRQHKQWLADAPKREAQAQIARQQRAEEFKRDAEERARKREEYRLEQEEIHRHRAATADRESKEYMASMIARETERKAALRKMIEESDAAKRAAKQVN